MKVGSLCTGCGGLEMGLRAVIPNTELVWVADNDKAKRLVLEARYPGVPNLGDITTVDWSTVEKVDILTAGIPCQPWSLAGKQGGIDDPRDLTTAFIKAVRTLGPKYVIVENVPGFRRGGLGRILGHLSEMGFRARWHSVRASETGAPHRRERVFVKFAHSADDGQQWTWQAWRGGGVTSAPLLLTPTANLGRNGGSQPPDKRRAGGHGPTLADQVEWEIGHA